VSATIHLSGLLFQGYWKDIGTVQAFFEANLTLTDTAPSFNFFDRVNPIYTQQRFLSRWGCGCPKRRHYPGRNLDLKLANASCFDVQRRLVFGNSRSVIESKNKEWK
jgi:hypothetical protein